MLWFSLFPDKRLGSNVIKGLQTGTVEECYSIGVERGAIVWDLGLWAPGFLIMFISVPYPCESSARAQNGITSNITPKRYQS